MRLGFYILIFLIQHCVALLGQTNVGSDIDADISLQSNLKVYPLGSFDNRDKSIIGSSLLFEGWQEAKLKPAQSDEFLKEPYILNYDLSSKEFIITKNGSLFNLSSMHISQIMINRNRIDKEIYETYTGEDNNYTLYKIIVDGNIRLLSLSTVTIVKPYYNVALNVGDLKPKYVQKKQLYIAINGLVYKLPDKRKSLFKSLATHLEIAQFLIDNKIDLKDEAEMKAAILNLNNKI